MSNLQSDRLNRGNHDMRKLTPQDFLHFCELAQRGWCSGSSGGEFRCRQLAKAILEYAPGIDSEALEGMITFARFAANDHALAAACVNL